MIRTRALRLALVALSGAILGQSSVAQGTDPFEAGLRWSHAPEASAPWIPRDVTFVGGGELVWAAPAVETPKLQLFAAGALGTATPLFETSELVGAIGEVRVAAGEDETELYAVAQYPMPWNSTRKSLVTRHDARVAAAGGGFAPRWTFDFGWLVNGPARVATSRDGARLVAAVFDAPRRLLHVAFLDPADGTAYAFRTLCASSS